ncbi:carboxymuconolactone decarboxylase family protein [Burkholderia ambifaria]|uniref:Carboxymuconolactone decarboxylase n=1 Tax=Burkholderia ambifaria MEX-5 TaxID=396597 RepID=B1SY39_9BURK|nr:carboxymuconolactone decarboxylase family protein [Burkholderia ambifaria]EDT43755.1 Carboxymuconolactone decarboxylase [Burkholderia ambifaria MEX-5]
MSVIHAIGSQGFSDLSAALDSLDPEFKRLLIEGAYADIIARPNLSLKHRELVTVAVLTTMGNADSTLKYHAAGMLNTGWAPDAVLATVLQTLEYAGVPVAMAGVRHVVTVLRERGIDIGHAANPFEPFEPYESVIAGTRELQQQHLEALTPKERELATLAIVIALENQHAAVRQHLNACLHVGWTRRELTEVLIQLTGYIGWPLVLPVSRIALDVFGAAEQANGSATQATPDRDRGARAAPVCTADISPEPARHLGEPGASTSTVDSVEHAKARHLTAIACLTCLARNADTEALVMHIRDARLLGASRHEIVDAIAGALPYAGVLATQSALAEANRLFASTDLHAASRQENAAA